MIPVFNESGNIVPLYEALKENCPAGYEFIFVDDGSTDDSLELIESLSEHDPACRCISLSRNFGHQHALVAGLDHARGKQVIIMDGDMQHPPTLIPRMLQLLNDGNDIVVTRRLSTAGSGIFKKWMTGLFYWFINRISDVRVEPNVADFKAFNRKVLKGILKFKERELFLRGIFSWIGYKTAVVDFEAPARLSGKTKYSAAKMFRLALKGATSFGFKPLRLALMTGGIISIAAFSFGIFAVIAYFQGNTVPGWASLIIAVMFLGGTQLLAIGLLGEYIASLFTESKRRPVYLIDRKINMKK